jgi:hypothetical protein
MVEMNEPQTSWAIQGDLICAHEVARDDVGLQVECVAGFELSKQRAH